MLIQDHLAYTLGRKDQEPNKLLAREIAEADDKERLNELIQFFESQPHKEYQKDCALTLAWIAEIKPKLIAPHVGYLVGKLDDPINRVIWGSMIALSGIAEYVQDELFEALPKILDAMDAGTVVTRDHGFRILITLYQNKTYQQDVFLLILEQLMKAPSNQLGQYTEKLLVVMEPIHKEDIIQTLESRLEDISDPHHIKRLHKNLKKLYKL
ncbi:MAG: hypothetical protein Tsb0034_16570 [Ekhidna sp.]